MFETYIIDLKCKLCLMFYQKNVGLSVFRIDLRKEKGERRKEKGERRKEKTNGTNW